MGGSPAPGSAPGSVHRAWQPLASFLIACANLTNLFLARSTTRQRELAVRVALGAGRWRLARHLITESLLLAVAGSAMGLALAWIGLRGSSAIVPQQFRFLNLDASMNVRVLWWSLGLAIVSGVLVGAIPAWHAMRANPHDALKADGRSGGVRRSASPSGPGRGGDRAVRAPAPWRRSADPQLPEHPARRSWIRYAGRADDEADAPRERYPGPW